MPKPFFTFAPIESKSQSAGDPITQAIGTGLPDVKVDKDIDDDKLINKHPRIRWSIAHNHWYSFQYLYHCC
jgi:hypothetical protein